MHLHTQLLHTHLRHIIIGFIHIRFILQQPLQVHSLPQVAVVQLAGCRQGQEAKGAGLQGQGVAVGSTSGGMQVDQGIGGACA